MCIHICTLHTAPKAGCLVIRSKFFKGTILCPLLLEKSPTFTASEEHSIYSFIHSKTSTPRVAMVLGAKDKIVKPFHKTCVLRKFMRSIQSVGNGL